jgi:hypothetical protein
VAAAAEREIEAATVSPAVYALIAVIDATFASGQSTF